MSPLVLPARSNCPLAIDDLGPPPSDPLVRHFRVYEIQSGATVAELSETEIVARVCDGTLDELLRGVLADWRERTYDYSPVADGLFEGDVL